MEEQKSNYFPCRISPPKEVENFNVWRIALRIFMCCMGMGVTSKEELFLSPPPILWKRSDFYSKKDPLFSVPPTCDEYEGEKGKEL